MALTSKEDILRQQRIDELKKAANADAVKIGFANAAEYKAAVDKLAFDQSVINNDKEINLRTSLDLDTRAKALDKREVSIKTREDNAATLDALVTAKQSQLDKLNTAYRAAVTECNTLLENIEIQRGYHYNMAQEDKWGRMWDWVISLFKGAR